MSTIDDRGVVLCCVVKIDILDRLENFGVGLFTVEF
jgi:hypothetical protein